MTACAIFCLFLTVKPDGQHSASYPLDFTIRPCLILLPFRFAAYDDARQAKAKTKARWSGSIGFAFHKPRGTAQAHTSTLPAGAEPLSRPCCPRSLRSSPTHHRWDSAAARGESSHAEAFYFQKQIHSQTLMIFVLEDGEQIEGTIEWYDRNAIKVRQGDVRTLIYKAGIKYLYKAADNNQAQRAALSRRSRMATPRPLSSGRGQTMTVAPAASNSRSPANRRRASFS